MDAREAPEDETSAVRHQLYCAPASHGDDPANDCASAIEDTHGLLTHVAQTAGGPRAYAEVRSMAPLVLSATACGELAARFTHLAHLIG